MPANDKSDWQIEKNKQKITTTKHGHRCSRLASGKVRFLGHKCAHFKTLYNLQRFKPLVQLDIILLGLQYLPDNYRVSYLYCYFNLKYLPK